MPSNCILYVWCRISWHNNRKTIVYIKFISASQDFEEFLTFSQNLPWFAGRGKKKKIQNHSEKMYCCYCPYLFIKRRHLYKFGTFPFFSSGKTKLYKNSFLLFSFPPPILLVIRSKRKTTFCETPQRKADDWYK